MKWLASTIAATLLATSLATPAFAAPKGTDHYDSSYRNGTHDRYGRHDRGLSKHEAIQQVLRTFDRIDRNNNNKISRKEVIAFNRKSSGGAHYHKSKWNAYRYDDKQDLITPRNFNRFDRNNNGVINRTEIRRAVQIRFERADRNNDGYLNEREVRQSGWFDFDDDYDWNRGRGGNWDYERDHHRR